MACVVSSARSWSTARQRGARHPVHRRARQLPGDGRLAVVFGGGATLGAYQVGVVDALARAGVEPDLLIGTSVGALNAAYWACFPGAEAGQRLLQLWTNGQIGRILSSRGWWLRLLRRSNHLFEATALRSMIGEELPAGQLIEQTTIPLAVVATDFETGERVELRRGSLAEALLASTAIPGLFPPVEGEGRLLVDGGLVANADLEAAVEAGAGSALVVDLMGAWPALQPRTLFQAVDRMAYLSLRRQTDLVLAAERGRIRVNLLRPTFRWLPGLGDFSHTRELFEMGRAAAEEVIR